MSAGANRRELLLGAAAAIPAATTLMGVSGVADGEIAAAATPALMPYTEHPFKWWVGIDGEIFTDDFDTREEAIEFARKNEYGHVAECCQQDFSLDIGGDEILEVLYGHNEEIMGEDSEFIACTPEQERDLGNMVTAAIEAWAVKHKIDITAWAFGEMRNRVDLSELAPPPTHREGPSG